MNSSVDLPSEFDVIVIGTGLPESILAAACSRSGLTVLHIDRNEYYGGSWASFNLDGLKEWIKTKAEPVEANHSSASSKSKLDQGMLAEGETFVPLPLVGNAVANVHFEWHVKETDPVSTSGPTDGTQPVGANSSVISGCDPESNIDQKNPGDHLDNACTSTGAGSEPSVKPKQSSPKDNRESSIATVDDDQCSRHVDDLEANGTEKQSDALKKETMVCGSSESPPEIPISGSIDDSSEISVNPGWSKTTVEAEWRRFSLDLTPKLLMSRGPLVDLLISSNVGRYAEFKVVNRILTCMDGAILEVPCSRADVFQSKAVSMIEKRMLMKFLTFVLNAEQEIETWSEEQKCQPFEKYLESQKLTPLLKHYVIHALGMVAPSEETKKSLLSIKKFLMSTGRYGNSPFLWALYGSGELPQCFCRLCAVFGGTYYLNRSIEALITDENKKCVAVLTEGHRISCKYLVIEESYLKSCDAVSASKVSRAIVCCDSSLLPGTKENISILNYFDPELQRPIRIIELNQTALVCAKGMHIVYMTVDSQPEEKATDVFKGTFENFFRIGATELDTEDASDENKPKVLFTFTFDQVRPTPFDPELGVLNPRNIVITHLPGSEISYEAVIDFVKSEFVRLWPDEDFLPAAPNPDDISFTDDLEEGVNGFMPEQQETVSPERSPEILPAPSELGTAAVGTSGDSEIGVSFGREAQSSKAATYNNSSDPELESRYRGEEFRNFESLTFGKDVEGDVNNDESEKIEDSTIMPDKASDFVKPENNDAMDGDTLLNVVDMDKSDISNEAIQSINYCDTSIVCDDENGSNAGVRKPGGSYGKNQVEQSIL